MTVTEQYNYKQLEMSNTRKWCTYKIHYICILNVTQRSGIPIVWVSYTINKKLTYDMETYYMLIQQRYFTTASNRAFFVMLGHKMGLNVKMSSKIPHEIRRRFFCRVSFIGFSWRPRGGPTKLLEWFFSIRYISVNFYVTN